MPRIDDPETRNIALCIPSEEGQLIVVEGPDGAGKSTLIQQMLDWFPSDLRVKPRHADTHGPITDLRQWVEDDFRDFRKRGLIYDRHPLISETIYGPLLRGSLAQGFNNYVWFMQAWHKLEKLRPLIIICLPPLEEVIDNVKETEQMEGVVEQIPTIYYHYFTLATHLSVFSHRIETFIYDYKEVEGNPSKLGILRHAVNNREVPQ